MGYGSVDHALYAISTLGVDEWAHLVGGVPRVADLGRLGSGTEGLDEFVVKAPVDELTSANEPATSRQPPST
jgi:hypothetical protein